MTFRIDVCECELFILPNRRMWMRKWFVARYQSYDPTLPRNRSLWSETGATTFCSSYHKDAVLNPKKSTYIEYLWYVSASLTYSRRPLSVDWFETSSDCLLILLVVYLERPVQIICSCGMLWFLAHQIRRSKMAPLSFCSPSTSHTPISHPPWNF